MVIGDSTENGKILALVAKAQDGDTEAYGKIYDQFFEPVYRYAALRVPREAAEDLVADVFVKVWEKLYTYKERKGVPFGAWLFRVARNEVVDAYRTTKTWEEVPEEVSDPDEWNRADTRTKKLYVLRIVRKALNQLPRRYREVLSLSFIAGLSNAEVAASLRMTDGAVRVCKFRALKELKALLPPELEESL